MNRILASLLGILIVTISTLVLYFNYENLGLNYNHHDFTQILLLTSSVSISGLALLAITVHFVESHKTPSEEEKEPDN